MATPEEIREATAIAMAELRELTITLSSLILDRDRFRRALVAISQQSDNPVAKAIATAALKG
jgi:hypothetical protein